MEAMVEATAEGTVEAMEAMVEATAAVRNETTNHQPLT
jgi:hypothetical protein